VGDEFLASESPAKTDVTLENLAPYSPTLIRINQVSLQIIENSEESESQSAPVRGCAGEYFAIGGGGWALSLRLIFHLRPGVRTRNSFRIGWTDKTCGSKVQRCDRKFARLSRAAAIHPGKQNLAGHSQIMHA